MSVSGGIAVTTGRGERGKGGGGSDCRFDWEERGLREGPSLFPLPSYHVQRQSFPPVPSLPPSPPPHSHATQPLLHSFPHSTRRGPRKGRLQDVLQLHPQRRQDPQAHLTAPALRPRGRLSHRQEAQWPPSSQPRGRAQDDPEGGPGARTSFPSLHLRPPSILRRSPRPPLSPPVFLPPPPSIAHSVRVACPAGVVPEQVKSRSNKHRERRRG